MAPHVVAAALAARWRGLMDGLGWAGNDAMLADLFAAYGQRHRHYHTLQHVADCLAHFDRVRDLAAWPHAIELALWFHDAVYAPRRNDNEQASADGCVRFVRDNDASVDLQERVHALILATRHDAVADDGDTAILIDIDLSVLGAAPDAYEAYRLAVRREYRWVPGLLFRRGRRAVLESFLERERIFLTAPFHASYEAQARTNIETELRVLR